MDLNEIHIVGHPTTAILVVTNSGDFSAVEKIASGKVISGDDVLRIRPIKQSQ